MMVSISRLRSPGVPPTYVRVGEVTQGGATSRYSGTSSSLSRGGYRSRRWTGSFSQNQRRPRDLVKIEAVEEIVRRRVAGRQRVPVQSSLHKIAGRGKHAGGV